LSQKQRESADSAIETLRLCSQISVVNHAIIETVNGAIRVAVKRTDEEAVNGAPESPCFSQGVGRACEIKAAKIGRQKLQ
jgi:DUF4097 and DUF4098 domain-containing protein YvlB